MKKVDTMLSKGFSEKSIFDLFEGNEKLVNEELNEVKERAKRAKRVYYLKNQVRIKEMQKKYYENHKGKYQNYGKNYRKNNKEKYQKYQKYQKEYHKKNKEKLVEYIKLYHKKNKEKSDKLIKGADAIEFLLDLKDERLTPINQYIKAYL